MKHAHTSTSSHDKLKQKECRRMKAAKLFAKGVCDAEIARHCRVSKAAVHNWHVIWHQHGTAGLKAAKAVGRRSKLTASQVAQIRRALLKGPQTAGYATQIWTLERIAKLIKKEVRGSYHPGNVWRVMRSMGWSCQKPETRARERDEKAIREWVLVKWPEIKKRGFKQGQLSVF